MESYDFIFAVSLSFVIGGVVTGLIMSIYFNSKEND